MGDNIYLGDRNGVRTPMQWSGDRNGGFSRADFARLYAPPIMDPVYGYQAINVEAQLREPHVAVAVDAADHRAAASGTRRSAAARSSSCSPTNRKILAYLRRYRGGADPLRRQSLAVRPAGRARPVAVRGLHPGRAVRQRVPFPVDRRRSPTCCPSARRRSSGSSSNGPHRRRPGAARASLDARRPGGRGVADHESPRPTGKRSWRGRRGPCSNASSCPDT